MWFKNLQIYRLPSPWAISLDALREQLARGTFAPPAGHEARSRGWVAPRADGELVYAQNRQWLIQLRTETRLLPSSVVNTEVRKRADALAEQQGYGPGRRQLRELRERVTEELLPRSHPVPSHTHVWIDPQAGWFIVNAATPAKAEQVIEHLRYCLDDFPLKSLHTRLSPQAAMADWLAGGEAPQGFTIDRDCELKAIGEEKSAVRYVRHPLGDTVSQEIKSHLASGQLPTKLALTWDDRLSFILTEKLSLRRLTFLDLVKEEAEKNAENADDQFAADFALMTGELGLFLKRLVEVLGGEVRDDQN